MGATKTVSLKKLAVVVGLSVSAMSVLPGSAFALSLPAVHNCGYPAPNNNLMCYTSTTFTPAGTDIYIASQHDDFISYGANILHTLYTQYGYTEFADWGNLPSFGSGQIIKLFTYNNAQNSGFPDATGGTGNHDSAPNADLTPPANQENPDVYSGNWPVDAQGNVISVTVGSLKAMLNNMAPVFTFDLNEGVPGLDLNGYFDVKRGDVVVKRFAFDNVDNVETYDSASLVTANREMTIPWRDPNNPECLANNPGAPVGFQDRWCFMNVDNNVGGGKPDFFAQVLGFDYDDFLETDTLFFHLYMKDIEGGGEELALTSLDNFVNVPEPAALALLGIGLFGLGAARMRKNRATA